MNDNVANTEETEMTTITTQQPAQEVPASSTDEEDGGEIEEPQPTTPVTTKSKPKKTKAVAAPTKTKAKVAAADKEALPKKQLPSKKIGKKKVKEGMKRLPKKSDSSITAEITMAAMRRMLSRAGVLRIKSSVYNAIRRMATIYSGVLLDKTVTFTEMSRRKTVQSSDVKQGCRMIGQKLLLNSK